MPSLRTPAWFEPWGSSLALVGLGYGLASPGRQKRCHYSGTRFGSESEKAWSGRRVTLSGRTSCICRHLPEVLPSPFSCPTTSTSEDIAFSRLAFDDIGESGCFARSLEDIVTPRAVAFALTSKREGDNGGKSVEVDMPTAPEAVELLSSNWSQVNSQAENLAVEAKSSVVKKQDSYKEIESMR
ncbi:hypothetical protein JHK84_044282 [Glycine max]|nr:hypothetical protein JHK84_044282 [Glycine max]